MKYGIVTSAPVIVTDFKTEGGPLLEQKLAQPDIARTGEDVARSEHEVGVDWKETVPISEAKRFEPGMFANQNIACKLRDPKTVEFERDPFGIPSE